MTARISLSLTEDEAALLEEAVGSGAYATPGEVMREALREWRGRRVLGSLWDEGIASGRSSATMDEIRHEARRRM